MATDLLTRALGHLEKEKNEAALELLIDAWRETRAPEIAEAVDAVDAIVGAPPLTKDAMKTWTATARQTKDAAERGPLIRAIASMTTSEILDALPIVQKWDDPRVGTLVIALLTELRFSGARSQPFWRPVFEKIPALRDPRFAGLRKTLPQTWSVGPSMQRWLTNHLEEASTFTTPLLAGGETQRAAQREKVADILQVARDRREARARSNVGEHAGGISGESLLAEIHANPTDDAARLVYADWLLERGDPRGEFISLQLRAGKDKDKAALKRERELLKAHKKEWLGRLAAVVGGDLVFRRGFLAEATVKFRHQRDVEQYGALPDWATLEQAEWGEQLVRDDQIEWSRYIGPAMSKLRIARGPMVKFLLVEGDPWALEELELWRGDKEEKTFRDIIASPRLSNLKRLTLTGWATKPTWLDGVTGFIPPQIDVWTRLDNPECEEWRVAAKPTKIETLVFRDWGQTRFRFTRDATGEFTRLAVEIRPRSKIKALKPAPTELQSVITLVGKLPAGSLTSFDAKIEVGGEMVEATSAIRAGEAKVRTSS